VKAPVRTYFFGQLTVVFWPCCSRQRGVQRGNEPVPAAREGLDEPRRVGGIAQSFAEAVDCRAEAMLEVHKGIARPKLASELLARHDTALPFQQKSKNLKRLALELDSCPIAVEFPSFEVSGKLAKPNTGHMKVRRGHGTALLELPRV
jgi:hypothetical protein